MRQGQNNRRSRGRSNNRRSNVPNRNQTFDSNGPDTRIRGNASQVLEKYQALARDAMSSGDPVMVENYLQHAEHYQRVINQMNEAVAQAQLQAEQAREQRSAAHQQPNGRAQPIQEGGDRQAGERQAGERQGGDRQTPERQGSERQAVERPVGNGSSFDRSSADPREQPAADFGSDPREESQPEVAANGGQTPAATEAAEPFTAPAPEAEPEEKPRRRRGRPRKAATPEEGSETAPASAE